MHYERKYPMFAPALGNSPLNIGKRACMKRSRVFRAPGNRDLSTALVDGSPFPNRLPGDDSQFLPMFPKFCRSIYERTWDDRELFHPYSASHGWWTQRKNYLGGVCE